MIFHVTETFFFLGLRMKNLTALDRGGSELYTKGKNLELRVQSKTLPLRLGDLSKAMELSKGPGCPSPVYVEPTQ